MRPTAFLFVVLPLAVAYYMPLANHFLSFHQSAHSAATQAVPAMILQQPCRALLMASVGSDEMDEEETDDDDDLNDDEEDLDDEEEMDGDAARAFLGLD